MKVMVFGSFDVLHHGHRNLFLQAKKHGEVVVVVSTDASIRNIKDREPRKDQHTRKAAVEKEPYVTKAIIGDEVDFLKVVETEQPDILFLGYDQETFDEKELTELLSQRGLHPRIIRGKPHRPDLYKSSLTQE